MKQQKPILHARDHLPGGADPIPSLGDTTAGLTAPPITQEYPGNAPPPGDPTGQDWHWWRFREPGLYQTSTSTSSPDVATNNPAYAIDMRTTGHTAVREWVGGQPGPNGDSLAVYRKRSAVPSDNPHNWVQAFASFGGHAPTNFGKGGLFSLVGWFNLDQLGNHELFHLYDPAAYPASDTYVTTNGNGSVTVHRESSTFTTDAGVVSAGSWFYWAVVVVQGRFKFYVNPGPAEPAAYDPTYGTAFPMQVPMAMETWGLVKGDYSAGSLANRLLTNGFKSVCVRLNPPPEELPPGMTHAAYITQLTADVTTLKAAGLQVVGWGPADATSGSDLTATGCQAWMPQIETAEQYNSAITQLGAGAGAGLPKAAVWTEGGINSSTQVTALNSAGITGYAVESYAAAGETFSHVDRLLWQGTQFGMTPAQSIPMIGTYRGETPADYIGFDENVLPNYGIYNVPQTSEAAWAAFADLNQGTLVLSHPLIDVADPATHSGASIFSLGGGPNELATLSTDGTYEGFAAECALYHNAAASSTLRGQYLAGKYSGGPIPPTEQIPPGGIQPGQIAPGTSGQHLVTNPDGTTGWAPDTGGGGDEWFTGAGPPAASLGADGDFYLDSVTGDYYERTGGGGTSTISRRTNTQAGNTGTSTPTSLTITRPSDLASGDLVVVAIWCRGISSATITLPGFTQLDTLAVGAARLSVFWKAAGGSEPASYTATLDGGGATSACWTCNAWSGANTTDPFGTVHATSTGTGGATLTTSSITPTDTATRVLALFMDWTTQASGNTTNWTATTPAVEVNDQNAGFSAFAFVSLEFCDDGTTVGSTAATTRSSTRNQTPSGSQATWIGGLRPGTTSPWTLRGNLKGPAGASASVSYGTTLPASPVDGQEAILVDSITNPSYQWRFRYNAGSSSSYKWEFLGGTDALAEIYTSETLVTLNTWSDLATLGPRVILPRAGDYDLTCGAAASHSVAGSACWIQPYRTTTPIDVNQGLAQYTNVANVLQSLMGYPARAAGCAAGDDLRLRYYNQAGSGTASFAKRFIRVRPVRVS